MLCLRRVLQVILRAYYIINKQTLLYATTNFDSTHLQSFKGSLN